MITTRPSRNPGLSLASTVPAAETPTSGDGLFGGWVRFWFTPVDPIGLQVLRVLGGLLFLAWLLPFAGNVDALFGLHGWFDQQAYTEAAKLPMGSPRPIGWSALYLAGESSTALLALYWTSVLAIVLFTLGFWTRLTSVLTWLAVASFTANPVLDYDGDALLIVLAFYLMLGHLFAGQRHGDHSPLTRLLGSLPAWLRRTGEEANPSLGANLALRLLQVHFAIIVMVAGLHKLQFGDWWGGVALWYPMYPPFGLSFQDIRANAAAQREFLLGYLSFAAYAVMAWQIAFPLYAWRPRWRFLLIGGALIGWAGMIFLYQLPLLGPAFLIGTLSFVTAGEWRSLFARLAHLPGLRWLAVRSETTSEPSVALERSEALVAGGHR